MHLEVLDPDRISLLKKITDAMDFQYYMAGGTGLALQIGTRQSVDFDFFVPEHFSSQMVIDKMHDISTHVGILQNTDDTCDLSVNDIQVSFFYYPKQMISPFVNGEEFPKLNIASVLDIGAMKLAAIGGRGAKKDFFDLYCVMKYESVLPQDLIDTARKKFPDTGLNHIIMSLTYFDDAENEVLPHTFIDASWTTIKKFFINVQPLFEQANLNSVII